ncbi:MAG: hypothetical protein ACNS60_10750 [Candidatus Cyclobacteriaceae bacterium M2_1C_046]
MNKFKKIWSFVTALAFTVLLSIPFSSCNNPGNQNENTDETEVEAEAGEHPEGYEEGEHPHDEDTTKQEGEHPAGEHPNN